MVLTEQQKRTLDWLRYKDRAFARADWLENEWKKEDGQEGPLLPVLPEETQG